jgi:HD-like signal output (HDOD) protein
MSVVALSPDRLLDYANGLPAAPQIMAQLNTLLHNANADLEQIAELLRRDASLAARVIRVANSPAYRGEGVASIEDALQRVGFSEVYRLAGLASVNQLAEVPTTAYGVTSLQVSENSLLTALACESLARRSGADPRAAYTVGLFRSIGKLVLGSAAAKVLGPDYPQAAGFTLEAWEQDRFGITSPEAGAIVLKVWGFPDVVVAGVLEQYIPDPFAPNHPIAALVNVASAIAAERGFGLPGEETRLGTQSRQVHLRTFAGSRGHPLWGRGLPALSRRCAADCPASRVGAVGASTPPGDSAWAPGRG